MLLVDDHEAERAGSRTAFWTSACVPTTRCISPAAIALRVLRRSAGGSAPVSSATRNRVPASSR